jgi:DNA repair protein RecN (Recombination protein N)
LRTLLGDQTQEAFRQAQKILMREKAPFFSDLLPLLEKAWISVDAIVTPLEASERNLRQASRTLEEVEDRLFVLRDLARQYGGTPAMLGDLRKEFQQRAEKISSLPLAAQKDQCDADEEAYRAEAERVSLCRHQAAEALRTEVMTHLQDLRLMGAEFRVDVVPSGSPGPKGQDMVTFLVRTNPHGPLRPLAQGGSGGELARFSLALYTVLAQSLRISTVIFDEIDTGTSGGISSAIGAKLRSLAEKGLQILTITHSPQVAAAAHYHIRVRKETDSRKTRSLVEPLEPKENIDALAQMLSAGKITDAARQVAKNLSEEA